MYNLKNNTTPTSLIGISGKIGAGKDTAGKIIQYLTTNIKHSYSFKDFINPDVMPQTEPNYGSRWQIKKFAYKLKLIVSILTGISVKDLEKEEIKNKKLGKEWIRYGYADGFKHIYEDGVKTTVMINKECSKERYEEEFKTNWQTAYKTELTPRCLLQFIGTDLFRKKLLEDIWVNALFTDYEESFSNNPWYDDKGIYDVSEEDEVCNPPMYPNWIITDVRFPNEFEAIKSKGGIMIRVNRTGMISEDTHESETALDYYHKDFDYVINAANITELEEMVKHILIKENII